MPGLYQHIIRFYSSLSKPAGLPAGVSVLYPQESPEVMKMVKIFYQKFYRDNQPRTMLFGINPGRFGAGITGVNFTAARQLKENCGIDHPFSPQSELSAEFIYEMIERYGGPEKFYSRFFISSVSPLGFVKQQKNLNYYDDPVLAKKLTPFIVSCMQTQYTWPINKKSCICIGGEKNFRFLSMLNEKWKWYAEIIPLPHPRFILQYRRKQKEQYIQQYLEALERAAA